MAGSPVGVGRRPAEPWEVFFRGNLACMTVAPGTVLSRHLRSGWILVWACPVRAIGLAAPGRMTNGAAARQRFLAIESTEPESGKESTARMSRGGGVYRFGVG